MLIRLALVILTLARTSAPWFDLPSTDGGRRTLRSYAGQVVLLVYEDRDSQGLNTELKREVARRAERERLGMLLAVVPVVDLRQYDYFPARSVVRSAMEDRARALGIEILLDFTGDIARAYGFRTPGSNVVLLGADGARLYQRGEPLDATERRRFHEVLSRALADARPDREPRL